MRTFSCIVTNGQSSTPKLCLILADNEMRARELALRELRDVRDPVAVEIREGDRLSWSEQGLQA